MRTPIQATTLHPQQTRMINACEGFRLEVLEGCLWLTRPGDESDRFLHAGASIDLCQDSVLVQCDGRPGLRTPSAHYRLVPLRVPAEPVRRIRTTRRGPLQWLQALTPSWGLSTGR